MKELRALSLKYTLYVQYVAECRYIEDALGLLLRV